MKLTDEQITKIYEFSTLTDSLNSRRYIGRGQDNKEKRIKDKILGTYGEFFINNLLNANYEEEILKIWKYGQYIPDIICGNLKISVKTQSDRQAQKYGKGFIFQSNDSIFSSGKTIYTHIAGLIIQDHWWIKDPKEYIKTINEWKVNSIIMSPVSILKYACTDSKLYPGQKKFLEMSLIRPEDIFSV